MHADLPRIAERARQQVERDASRRDLASLQSAARGLPQPRNFFRALVDPEIGPPFRLVGGLDGPGVVVANAFDPELMARRYQRAGASALAVFESPSDADPIPEERSVLASLRNTTPLPVLHHRLVVDPYQLWQSRIAGADAVLLMAEVLTEGEVIDFQILARELGMTAVIEVRDEWNLLRVIRHVGFPDAAGCLLAIDNRDPETGMADPARTVRLAGLIEERPIILSEHGLRQPSDVVALRRLGVHAGLVAQEAGDEDPVERLARLLEPA